MERQKVTRDQKKKCLHVAIFYETRLPPSPKGVDEDKIPQGAHFTSWTWPYGQIICPAPSSPNCLRRVRNYNEDDGE